MSLGARGSQNVVQWPKGGGGWASALTMFAKSKSPRSSLPEGVYLRSDDQTLAIYDGYAKAKFHFLVLPRIPFVLQQGSAESSQSRKPENDAPKLALNGSQLSFGMSVTGSTVPDTHLRSLNSLLASPYAMQVFRALEEQSRHVIQLIKEEMRHTPLLPNKDDRTACEVDWGIRVGFHAVPSMETVHLHIISDDLVSEKLKHKKHYQSFHPTHGFWLDLDYILGLIESGNKKLPHAPDHYENLLKRPLISFRNGRVYKDMPSLKRHLDEAWVADIVKRRSTERAVATAGTKHRRESEIADESARTFKAGRSTSDANLGE